MSDLCMVCNANAMDSDDVKNLSLAVPLGNDHIISPQHEREWADLSESFGINGMMGFIRVPFSQGLWPN